MQKIIPLPRSSGVIQKHLDVHRHLIFVEDICNDARPYEHS